MHTVCLKQCDYYSISLYWCRVPPKMSIVLKFIIIALSLLLHIQFICHNFKEPANDRHQVPTVCMCPLFPPRHMKYLRGWRQNNLRAKVPTLQHSLK